MDVSFSSVCPVIDHEFRHSIVKLAVDSRGAKAAPAVLLIGHI